VQSNG